MNDNHTANSQPIPAQPKNYLAESILVTLFCNIPCGIVGIVKAETLALSIHKDAIKKPKMLL